jgi:hypothetical protein
LDSPGFKFQPSQAILTVFHGFPLCLQVNAWLVPQWWSLLSISIPLCFLLIILSFSVIFPEQTAPQRNFELLTLCDLHLKCVNVTVLFWYFINMCSSVKSC